MQETGFSVKFQLSEKFAVENVEILLSPVLVYRKQDFHEFQSLVEFPEKCGGGIAVTGRSPRYYSANIFFMNFSSS